MTDDNLFPPEIQRLYINAVAARGGAFDLTLDLGYALPSESLDQPSNPDWLVRVSMSWEHAASLIGVLQGAIQEYEKQVGALPPVDKLQTIRRSEP